LLERLQRPATRMGMQMMSDDQEQQQAQPMPMPQMAPPQQPLAIPGGFDMPPMDINGPMTEEERKWKMLLAQLQGGRA
jgi:hypothetical protein